MTPAAAAPGAGSAKKAARHTAQAEIDRGFNPAAALQGVGSSRKGESEQSACTTRGDGKYDNGKHFTLQETAR